MPSLTTQIPNLQFVGPLLQVKVDLPQALKDIKAISPEPQHLEMQAMIDTGATGTVVKAELIEKLKLNPVGVVSINTPSSTGVKCNQSLSASNSVKIFL